MDYSFIQAFKNRDDLINKYKSNALLLFALEMKFDIDDIHTIASDALTDSNDDKKADLVYINLDNEIAVIAQAYCAQDWDKPAAPPSKASDLNTAAVWLLSRNISDLPSDLQEPAKQLRYSIKEKKIKELQFWYVHNLPESKNVSDELKSVEVTAKNTIKAQFNIEDLNIKALEVGVKVLEEWYKSMTIPIILTKTFDIPMVTGGFELKNDGIWQSYVTTVTGSWLYEIYNKHKTDLFSANPRGFLGFRSRKEDINSGIQKSAKDDEKNFWAFNNGITALVYDYKTPDITGKSNILETTGLAIINGAQTTGALGSMKNPPKESVNILIRFIVCKDKETIKNIIKYNNRQNEIESADLRSNDSIQKRLRKEFVSIPNVSYNGGRRGEKKEKDLLSADTAAQSLTAFHGEPIIAYNDTTSIWMDNKRYSAIFNQDTHAEHIVFVYALRRAIENKKLQLKEKGLEALDTEKEQLAFLRKRGATVLYLYAISECLEIYTGRKITNRFRLSFNKNVSPETAIKYWSNIINITVPLVGHLSDAIEGGMNNKEKITEAVSNFRSLIASVAPVHAEIYKEFNSKIIFK